MKKFFRYVFAVWLLSLFATTAVSAAEWCLTKTPVGVPGTALSGEVALCASGDVAVSWYGAWGVELAQSGEDGVAVGKNIGEEAYLILAYQFPFPLKSFQVESPAFQGVDLTNGAVGVDYALGIPENFKSLISWDKNVSDYLPGGNLSPAVSAEVKVPAGEGNTVLYIRIHLQGYARKVDFANFGKIIYQLELDRAGEVDLKVYPDAADLGNVYRVDERFRFTCSENFVDKVTITDVSTGQIVGEAGLTAMGGRYWGDLPGLDCGVYELNFLQNNKEPFHYRFVLVPSPRYLTFEQMRKSPFGIVGISRTGGFREFPPVNGPGIAALIGIHQERSGFTGCWAEVCPAPGEYKFVNTPEEVVEFMASSGILQHNNLAWTPDWAVDKERLKKDNYTGWTGHYPPKDEHYKDLAEFSYRLADRYKDSMISEFEIWNEPNNEPYASFKGNFDEFVRYCRTAAEAVHKADPNARMILGTTGDADVAFIARLLKQGLGEEFDIVDIHPYRHTSQGPEDGLLGDINRLKKAIELYGSNQKIIFSEVGWPTTSVNTGGYGKVTELEQACFNTRTLLISMAAGVERIHFHMMEDWGRDLTNAEFNFGFFRVDRTPKIAVGAMAGCTRHMEGTRFMGRLATADFTHVWYWTTPWEEDMVLATVWTDTQVDPNPENVILPGLASGVYNMFGAKVVGDRIVYGKDQTIVRPGADPLYIYLPKSALPELKELPIELRPWLKKRVDAPFVDTKKIPDFQNLRYSFSAGADLKTMGFAGVESDLAKTVVDISPEKNHTRFDVGYDDTAIRLSFRIPETREWKNDRSGWWLWAGDCVRIFLGRGDVGFLSPEHYQLCFAPTSAAGKPQIGVISYDSVGNWKAGDELPAELYVERDENYWYLSARILWKDLNMTPQACDIWSLDVSGMGGFWNNYGSDSWTNPTRWGELCFQPSNVL